MKLCLLWRDVPPKKNTALIFVSSKSGLINDWRNLERFNIWVVVRSQHWKIRDVQLIQSFPRVGQTINYSGTYLGQIFNKAGIYMVHILDLTRIYLGFLWEISGTYSLSSEQKGPTEIFENWKENLIVFPFSRLKENYKKNEKLPNKR